MSRALRALFLPWGCLICGACAGPSVEGGEVRPVGEGMRRVSALSTTQCHVPAASGGAGGAGQGREVRRGSQVEIWDGGSDSKPARVLVEHIADHQALQVHRSFNVAGGVQYEVVLEPPSGPPLLQRYVVRTRASEGGVQGSLEVVRDFTVDSTQPSVGGRVVLRCQLVETP